MTPERVQRLTSIRMVWDAQRGGNRQRGRYLSSTTTDDIATAASLQDSAALPTGGIIPPNSLLSRHYGTTLTDPAAGVVGPWLRPTTSSSATAARRSNPFLSLRNPLSLANNLLHDPNALSLLGTLSGIEPTQTDTVVAPPETRKTRMGLGHSTSDLALPMLHPSFMMESPHVLAALATATNVDQRRAAEQALARTQQEHNRQFASSATTPRRTPPPTAVDSNNASLLLLAGREAPASIATRGGVDALASRILRETSSLARTASLASASRNQFLSEQHYLSSGVLDPLMFSGLSRVGGTPPTRPGTTLFPYHGMLQTAEESSSTSNAGRRALAGSTRPVPAQFGTAAIPPVGSQHTEHQQAALLLRAAVQGISRNPIFDYREAAVLRAAALSQPGHDLLSRQQEQQVGTMSSRAPAVSANVAMPADGGFQTTRTGLSIVDVGSRVAGDDQSKTEPAEDRLEGKGKAEEKG